jgi:hypothetical protein
MNIKFIIILIFLVLVWFSFQGSSDLFPLAADAGKDSQEGFFIGQGTGPTATCGTRFGSRFCA